jgi:hypothetical protein
MEGGEPIIPTVHEPHGGGARAANAARPALLERRFAGIDGAVAKLDRSSKRQ